MHGYQSDGRPFINPITCDASLTLSKVRNPFYALRNEFRSALFDPTSFMIITIDTYDMSSSSYVIVGHAVMPLFLDKTTKNPVVDERTTEFHLHSGNF